MLSRSKVKMQESVKQVHQNLPSFNQEEQPHATHMYKQSKHPNHSKVSNHYSESNAHHYRSDYIDQKQVDYSIKKVGNTRNQLLKELRQEYEILKNLPIDDNSFNFHSKKNEYQDGHKYSQSSSVSSSVHSKKTSKVKQGERQFGSPKLSNKEIESMHFEKKQLEIVIGNSMRKIEELLNNEIVLKKNIHELKNQIEGKGGVHQEYEKIIKSMQKNVDELQEQLEKSSHQNEKTVQKIKQLSEKIRFLQGQVVNKDRQLKQSFDEQRKLHELIRIQKDKFLNLQIQCKTYKMEFDLLQKEKNNQMNRLIRQFESKQGGNQRQMAYMLKKLEEEIKEKDKKYHDLLVEKQQLKRDKDRDFDVIVQKKSEKNYLEQLMYKSRQMNDYNNKALADSMNIIILKMAEIQKKNDVTLKRQIEALKKKTDDNKKNTNEADLLARITDLQRMIERQVSEKNRLAEDIKTLKEHRYELEDKNKALDKKTKALQQRERQLKQEIQELEHIKDNFNSTFNEHKRLQDEGIIYTQKIKALQSEIDSLREYSNSFGLSFIEKERKYEDQIRVLKRKVDQAEFKSEKTQKSAEFNISILQAQHESDIKRIIEQNNRIIQKLKDSNLILNGTQAEIESKLKAKQIQIINLKSVIQTIKGKSQEEINNQKQFYSQKIATIQAKHSQETKIFNDKFISVSSANEKLIAQITTYSRMQSQMIELRRGLKHTRALNSNINHLWDIKETEYGNINEILSSLKVV